MEIFSKLQIGTLIFGLTVLVTLFHYISAGSIAVNNPETFQYQDPSEIVNADSRFFGGRREFENDLVNSNYSCPVGWILNSDSSKCFRVINTPQSWEESINFCREFGGDLASLHSESDLVLAKSLIAGDTWIGLNDIQTEGVMLWSDSSDVDFESWASGEPNNDDGSEDCVEMERTGNYDFNDEDCTDEQSFLCQKLSNEVPLYQCPEGWILNSDSSKCFLENDAIQSWQDSQVYCREFGGDLASLHSETDFVLAKSLVTEDTWIGLNDIEIESYMQWSDNSEVDFTSWADGEPNNEKGSEDCVELQKSANFNFNDEDCSVLKRILCEIITGVEEMDK